MLLIAAATQEELTPTQERLADRARYLVTGVGSVAAAVSTSVFLSENRMNASRLIFIGSYGTYTESVPILSTVTCRKVHFGDSAAADGFAHIPMLLKTSCEPNGALATELGALADFTVSVVSPGSILDDRERAQSLAKSRGAQVENLELFGVAMACEYLNVSWGAAGVVTNQLGPDSGAQWKENAPKAAQMTVSLLESIP